MVCKKCGIEMSDEERYCLRCGHDQTVEVEVNNTNNDCDSCLNERQLNKSRIVKIIIIVAVVISVIVGSITIISTVAAYNAHKQVQGMFDTVDEAIGFRDVAREAGYTR